MSDLLVIFLLLCAKQKITQLMCVCESNKDGGREIEDKEGNIQTERGLENNRESERGREREGIEKQVAKL